MKELELLTSIEKRLARLELRSKEVLTPEEAAEYMGVNKAHIYKLVGGRHPQLKSSRPGGRLIFIRKDDLLDYLMSNERMTGEEMELITDKIAGRV